MARWTTVANTWSAVAAADGGTLADSQFHILQGGSTTQRNSIIEVFVGGQATSSAVSIMMASLDSTVAGATISGAPPIALDRASAALAAPPLAGTTTSGAQPVRGTALNFLNLSFNLFGGVVRWVAAPGEELGMLGNATNAGELSLSAFTGSATGPVGSHIIFEPF